MKKKVLFIASTGGHLEELMQLKGMFQDYDYHIITEKQKMPVTVKEIYDHLDRIAVGQENRTD